MLNVVLDDVVFRSRDETAKQAVQISKLLEAKYGSGPGALSMWFFIAS